MHTVEPAAANNSDYRTSHLAKGASYDANLAGDAFDAHMDAKVATCCSTATATRWRFTPCSTA